MSRYLCLKRSTELKQRRRKKEIMENYVPIGYQSFLEITESFDIIFIYLDM